MTNQNNIEIIKKIYTAFQNGVIPGILEYVGNKLEWKTPAGNELGIPEVCNSRQELQNFFYQLDKHYEFTDFQPRTYIQDGDKVIALGDFQGISKYTNKKFQSDFAMEWTVTNGKVTKYKSFFDTYNFIKAERPDKDNINIIEIALSAMEAFETGNEAKNAIFLSNNFKLEGPVPQPLNKEQYIAFAQNCVSAIPDWKFNISNIKIQGNQVDVTVQITGTQTNILDLHFPGVEPIQPTNKKFEIPQEVIQFTILNNKIEKAYIANVPGGGIPGLFEQLGHPLPKM